MRVDCAYCGCDVTVHDPLTVTTGVDGGETVGRFCSYGCLAAWIDAEELTVGTNCRVDV